MAQEPELRIVLIGRTGSGKSATGNTILGLDDGGFKSSISANSTTKECEKKECFIDGRKIIVLDTPGFFDSTGKSVFCLQQTEECIKQLSPGPHAIVIVIKIASITQEGYATIREIKKFFSVEGKKFLILLFTCKDALDGEGLTLEQFLGAAGEDLKALVDLSEKRCIAFNNKKGDERSHQVKELIAKIDGLVALNGARQPCYSVELFKKDHTWHCSVL